jgi:hypothetical protein
MTRESFRLGIAGYAGRTYGNMTQLRTKMLRRPDDPIPIYRHDLNPLATTQTFAENQRQ